MIAAPPGTEVRDSVLVMVGQPNAGKTTLYNLLTGSRFKTVNYPGATVDYAVGTLRAGHGVQARVLDTPGIHSLVPQSEDERTALLALGQLDGLGDGFPRHPDLVLAVVDAMQLTRHLVLVRQIQRAGFRVLIALTMEDLARKDGTLPDLDRLSARLGVPVVAVNGRTGKGVSQLMRACQVALEAGPTDHPVVLPEVADEEQIRRDYEWAESIVARAGTAVPAESAVRARSMKLDQIMLHPVLGLAIFVGIMSLLFWSVFSVAAPFMDGIDAGVSWIVGFLDATLPAAWWSDFLVDGLLAGAGAVLVFVPQIAILFFAVGILEDSGYLARGAVLIDRPLSLLGLNGRSFVPLLSGYACAVPAMMAARTIPGRRERFLTIFIIPLMSCSARLPVYGLLLAFLVPSDKAWIGGLSLTAIYLGSLGVAAAAAVVAGRFIKLEHGTTGFQLELPLWRRPIWRNILVSTWDKTLSYLKRAGPVIVLISLLFWAFSNYPSPDNSIAGFLGRLLEPVLAPMGVDWRVGMALIASFAAREVFVSALAVVFAVQGGGDSVEGLIDSMRGAVHASTGEPLFTVATGVGLVLFFMVAMQCLTTIAVSRRETAGWKIPVAQMVAFLGLAYLLAVVAVQGLRALGIS